MAEVQSLTIDLENKGLMISRPGDLLPPGFLSSLMNMTANKTGYIESRRGSSLVSGTALPGAIHSQGRIIVNGTPYIYQGVGGALYRAFSSIATGFSGNPLVMRETGPEQATVPQLIAFDSIIRMKDDGTRTTNYGIAGPMAEAAAVAAAATVKTIDEFEYTSNPDIQAEWTVDTSTVTTSTVDPYAGTYAGNLNVAASALGTITRTVALDLSQFSAAGDSDDSDWIFVALRLDVPANLIEVRLEFDVDPSANDFDHNYYWKAFTASEITNVLNNSQSAQSGFIDIVTGRIYNTNDPAFLRDNNIDPNNVQPVQFVPGADQWTGFAVAKKDFTRVGTDENDWADVAAVRISVQTNSLGAINLGVDDLKLQGGTLSRLDGTDYEWIYRYENEITQSVSPFSPPMTFTAPATGVTVEKTKATVTVRNPRDTQATHIQLYRRGGDNSVFSFVLRQVVSAWTGTVAITDGIPDASLGDTADETQVEMANLLRTPSAIPTSFRKTISNGVGYTDYTAAVGDDNSGTYADLSILDNIGDGDWFVVGADQPFRKILTVMDSSVNTNTSTLAAQYWNGSAWRSVQGLIDGTSVGGKTLSQGGSISFAFPDDWERNTIGGVGAYYVRLTVSAILSAAVHVIEARVSANAFEPTVCETHGGRVWTDDSLHADRVWYSQRFSIEQFLEDNFIITTNGDAVVRPFSLDDQLFIFTRKTVERVVGSSADSFQPLSTSSEQGLFSKYAICKGNAAIWYRGYDGIYKLPGSGFSVKVSLQLDQIFHGYDSEDGTMKAVDPAYSTTETMEFFDTRVMFGYTDTAGHRREIQFDIETERWEPTDRPVTSYLRLDDTGNYYSGHSDGYVYQREVGNQDNGSDIAIRLNTGYQDFGAQSNGKQITEIVIDADLAGETVDFFAGFDNGTGSVPFQTVQLSNSVRGPLLFPLSDDTQARNVALGVDSSNGGSLVKFYKVTFFYIMLPALVSKLPTEWDDLGYIGDKRLRQLQIEVDTKGANVSVAVQVDGATAQTLTVNTTSRKIVPFSLSADIIGKMTRLIMTGSSPGFRYYTHQFEFQRDPLQMSRYDTIELDFGYTRMKVLRRVWVAASTPATVTMEILTDRISRYTTTFTMAAGADWGKQELILPPGLKGMLFRFVFTSAQQFKIFLDQSDVEWKPLAEQRGYRRAPMAKESS